MNTAHSIVNLPILHVAPGATLPLLILQDGEPSLLSLAWARERLLNRQCSQATLSKAVSALGRFYDFYTIEKKSEALQPSQLPHMLKQFFEARRFGLSSLGWKASRLQTAKGDLRSVQDFTDWCSENFGHCPVNPKEAHLITSLGAHQKLTVRAHSQAKDQWSLLSHLAPATKVGRGEASVRAFSPQERAKPTTGHQDKSFPQDKVMALIHATPSIKDKLFFLLLFFGGLRISEPLHLFANDVAVGPDGIARVTIAHPQDGVYSWAAANGKAKISNRAAFLKEKYGIGPRNLLGDKHPLHAGWKGLTMDNGKRMESTVHWLREDAGKMFAALHMQYIKQFRCTLPDDHPYYFANERSGESRGSPTTLSNITKAFYRAAGRVGLSASQAGVNPHGARHFYGFYCASLLRLPVETTQKLLHHQSIQSTQVYYCLSNKVVRDELAKAQAIVAATLPPLLPL